MFIIQKYEIKTYFKFFIWSKTKKNCILIAVSVLIGFVYIYIYLCIVHCTCLTLTIFLRKSSTSFSSWSSLVVPYTMHITFIQPKTTKSDRFECCEQYIIAASYAVQFNKFVHFHIQRDAISMGWSTYYRFMF